MVKEILIVLFIKL